MLQSHPSGEKINWSTLAESLNILGKNKRQVLKEFAVKRGFDTLVLEHESTPTPVRTRRHKKRLPGGETSIPSLPPPAVITAEKREMLRTGKLSLGEPCSPYAIHKTVVTGEGEIKTELVQIVGRKLSMLDIQKKLLHKQNKYMRLLTDEEIENVTQEEIIKLLSTGHCQPPVNTSLTNLREKLASIQQTRTLALWHDHSTVLSQGYIMFAVKVLYDSGVFLTEAELGNIHNLQEEIEQPVIQMVAPSSSSLSDQLALVPDKLESLEGMAEAIPDRRGVPVNDRVRFFIGDKPAQQFEHGTQVGGAFKCGGCGYKDYLMQDLSHALQCPPRSLESLQTLILSGKYGNRAGLLKPLDKLRVAELKVELTSRGVDTTTLKKPEMQEKLTELLRGAQRVPSLLVLNPGQPLKSLHLGDYEVLDCEPLHDLKGHGHNLLSELPHVLEPPHRQAITQIIQTTLKDSLTGAHIRVAIIKVYLKLLKLDVSEKIKQLMGTLVKMSQLLYLPESARSPKTVLQLYNVTWFHHELCCELIPNPITQTREKLYGAYFHDLIVHAPPQYQIVSLRSTNTESTERQFSQVKHIGLKATNRKPENVLTAVLLGMQAKEMTGATSTIASLQKQATMVTEVAKKVPKYRGTVVSQEYIKTRLASWQAHLQRISLYLQVGEGIWWEYVDRGYTFLDSDTGRSEHPQGPGLDHFRDTTISKIWEQSRTAWKLIIEQNRINLPTPYIRIFNGEQYVGRRHFPIGTRSEAMVSEMERLHTLHTSLTPHTSLTASEEIPATGNRDTPHTSLTASEEIPATGNIDTPYTSLTASEEIPATGNRDTPHTSLTASEEIPATGNRDTPQTSLTASEEIPATGNRDTPHTSLTASEEIPATGNRDTPHTSLTASEEIPATGNRDTPHTSITASEEIPATGNRDTPRTSVLDESFMIDCDLPIDSNEQGYYQTKAANQIKKAIGEQHLLSEFDQIRIKLKETANRGQTPTKTEKEYYKTILAKLQTQLLCTKYRLKAEVKEYETHHYISLGNMPNRQDDPSLDKLHKKLDYVRKLTYLWHKFNI